MVKTVWDKPEQTDKLIFPNSSLEDNHVTEFTIQGQTNTVSFEGRDVYFAINSGTTNPESELGTVSPVSCDLSMWLKGEDAIEMGMKLIEHGKFALMANIVNHQSIHMNARYAEFLVEDRIEEVEFKVIDENPPNYGDGFRTYLITPLWRDGREPTYERDFTLEKVIYWSPFDVEFNGQILNLTNGRPYTFVGYDRQQELEDFRRRVEELG